MNYSAEIEVSCPLHSTELEDRIKEAIHNVFPSTEISIEEFSDDVDEIHAESHSVEKFRELVNRQNINDSVLRELKSSIIGESISFDIKKQPAYVGRLNLDVGGHELGSIRVIIHTSDPERLIEYMTSSD